MAKTQSDKNIFSTKLKKFVILSVLYIFWFRTYCFTMSKQENMILLENGELATNKENDTDSMLSLEDASDTEHVVQGGFGYLMSSPCPSSR